MSEEEEEYALPQPQIPVPMYSQAYDDIHLAFITSFLRYKAIVNKMYGMYYDDYHLEWEQIDMDERRYNEGPFKMYRFIARNHPTILSLEHMQPKWATVSAASYTREEIVELRTSYNLVCDCIDRYMRKMYRNWDHKTQYYPFVEGAVDNNDGYGSDDGMNVQEKTEDEQMYEAQELFRMVFLTDDVRGVTWNPLTSWLHNDEILDYVNRTFAAYLF